MLPYTQHGMERSKQRGIPPLVIDWLIEYGRVIRHKSADVYSFDHGSRRRLRGDIGSLAYKRLSDFFNAYVVLSDDGRVVTTGWRLKRLKT